MALRAGSFVAAKAATYKQSSLLTCHPEASVFRDPARVAKLFSESRDLSSLVTFALAVSSRSERFSRPGEGRKVVQRVEGPLFAGYLCPCGVIPKRAFFATRRGSQSCSASRGISLRVKISPRSLMKARLGLFQPLATPHSSACSAFDQLCPSSILNTDTPFTHRPSAPSPFVVLLLAAVGASGNRLCAF